jgi:N-acetylmuramoyl-L-alanine amidase
LGKQVDARIGALQPAAAPPPVPAPREPKSSAANVTPPSAPLAAGNAAPADATVTPADQRTAAPKPGTTVTNITQTALQKGDRITIEVSSEVNFQSDRVPNPDRLFFDFPNTTAATALAARAREINSPLIKAIRIGRPTAGVTRVVLELAGTPKYSAFPLYGPFRLVVDLEGTAPPAAPASNTVAPTPPPPPPLERGTDSPGPAAPGRTVTAEKASAENRQPSRANAPAPSPAPAPATPPPLTVSPGLPSITSKGDYSLARQLGLGISRIVIDAGHGGHDPGAQANGINESELVLDVSLRLEKLLAQRPGFDVVLTRKTDEFIPLEERTAIANREGADLFLSIHANASKQPIAHGVETYILNFATNPAAEAVAARENATSAQTMGTLPAILKAIALNNKLAESRELATILQTSMVRKLRVPNKSLKDLGVKQAPFVVLIGAQMPSVLAEISFVTNKPEASLLRQAAYRQQIAEALCDAIVKYQNSLKKITTGPAPSARATGPR